jgi:hypothetical protein
MPKSQVEITIGKPAAGANAAARAIFEVDNAASDAPAADIFINLRRLYITANIEIRFRKSMDWIFIDKSANS